jgi:hypothetical protein
MPPLWVRSLSASGEVRGCSPARACLMYTCRASALRKHKKRSAGRGAYSGDLRSIGPGLCRILHPDFGEFPFYALR